MKEKSVGKDSLASLELQIFLGISRYGHEILRRQYLIIHSQTNLPEGAIPLAYIIYSDKSKLSTFRTQKAYSVMAKLAQLSSWIRNGNGIGGAQIIGWLDVASFNFLPTDFMPDLIDRLRGLRVRRSRNPFLTSEPRRGTNP